MANLAIQSDQFKHGEDVLLVFNADATITSWTAWSLEFCLAEMPGDTALLTKTPGAGLTIVDDTTVYVVISDGDYTNIPPGLYYGELHRTDTDDETVLATITLYFDGEVC